MKILNINIENYKAIEKVEMKNLGQLVLIAGSNGVGKSCILDAIRIFKTSYGSYDQNEWRSFLNEFQINKQAGNQIENLFRDKKKPIIIEIEIEISQNEKTYIEEYRDKKIEELIWKSLTKQSHIFEEEVSNPSTEKRIHNSKFEELKKEALINFNENIKTNLFKGRVELYIDETIKIEENIILDLLFSIYEPELIGIIDFHGPNRSYVRENVTNLNVDFNRFSDNKKAHALYNSQNKYNNVKTELATSYIKGLIVKESKSDNSEIASLDTTLQELFRIFFPTKQFLGINPTFEGTLEYPVKVGENLIHDINELSSGEKEILFGYLRLRNSTPKNSVILIDEPELHLNPLIAQKLPEFYYKYVGNQCNNQIWLITHSEAILKESYGNSNYSVFHLRQTNDSVVNQACELTINSEIESALIDLVGDLSMYKPDNKILILESENSEFDKSLVQKLFPEYSKEVNIISAGSKNNVSNLHQVLEKAKTDGILTENFYSITDSDFTPSCSPVLGKSFQWDVYHIENFLLEPKYIQKVIQESTLNAIPPSEKVILEDLKQIAKESINLLIRQTVSNYVDDIIYKSGVRPNNDDDLSLSYHNLALEVNKHITKNLNTNLSVENLKKIETEAIKELEASFENGDWIKKFKGREILKKYSSRKTNLRYQEFRNLIINKMSYDGFEPNKMKEVLEMIIND